ncbi:MAG: type II toxin-antitoxin system ParD family antitoxin [Gemmatimonadota bacterium]|jgi:antitoxin ParD1/3/4|nr:type II toxin-antitoxin system ParD family antitoxin [Gemmatimonadota bacterium]
MNVSLTPELARFVEEKVHSGLYHSQSEVVRAGLRLLKERDQLHEVRLAELRKDVALGLDQARRGELLPGEEVFEELAKGSGTRRRKHA